MNEAFERDKATYEQNFEQFRSLNQTMWQVPVIAMTLTGGLWFGAARVGDMPAFQYLLLLLAALVLTRVRHVMGQYLEAMKRFNEAAHVTGAGTGIRAPETVARTFRTLLLVSAVISAVGIGLVYHANRGKSPSRRVLEVIQLTK